jgi:hypothetical protein
VWAVAQNQADHLLEALVPRIQAEFTLEKAMCARQVLIAEIKAKLMTERDLSGDYARKQAVKLTNNILSKAFLGYKVALAAHLESVAAHQATIREQKRARLGVGAGASGLSSKLGVCNNTRRSTAELATEPTSYKLCAACLHSFVPPRPHCTTSLRLTHALHLQHLERMPPLAVRLELKPQAAPTPRTAPPSAVPAAPTAKPMADLQLAAARPLPLSTTSHQGVRRQR